MANWTIHLSRLASGSLIPVDKILNMQFYNFEIHIYTRQSFATIALCIRTPYYLNSLWFIFKFLSIPVDVAIIRKLVPLNMKN